MGDEIRTEHSFLFQYALENPEPVVEFDTIANKKQQHEINDCNLVVHKSQPVMCFVVKKRWLGFGENKKVVERMRHYRVMANRVLIAIKNISNNDIQQA
ncbi:hypothetical protein CTI12_AA488700 [Artemisia annua]|uniref:Uncharacterized protein n=1 Tax=Artemisia annua TaxID=35608 RepID=A0A2U1LI48_ARTAN|nr:hypothetical protein CTI12_AA488700 [Artemisia annua]